MKNSNLISYSFLLMLLATLPTGAQVFTNVTFFTNTIPLNGDITNFFLSDGMTPKPGVCVANDPNGLNESPLSEAAAWDAQKHPSGFNQRRIMSAYNPNLNGGTIYIGIDLPGGSGADSSSLTIHSFPGNANPNYFDGVVGADLGGWGFGRGKIVPFDADGNGEADTIGRKQNGSVLFRCFGMTPDDTCDIVTCRAGAAGLTDNPRSASGETLGVQECYVATVTFGNNQTFCVELLQDTLTPPGIAQLRTLASPIVPFSALVSTSTGGSGAVFGYDVEMAITNVNNAVPDLCARLHQTIIVSSGSNRDGSAQADDYNLLGCSYVMPIVLELARESEGIMRITALIPDGRPCMIQRSTNLIDWEDWELATPTNCIARLIDASAGTASHRFYRAVLIP